MGCPRPTLSYWRVCLLPILALCMGFGVQTAFARPAANSGGATYRPRDVAPAEALVKPVLVHPSTQTAPAIDGRRVVWQDERSGPADIYLADLDTGAIRNLTNSYQWEAIPDISGNYVVWLDGYMGMGIHGVDISTGTMFTVTVGHRDMSRPSIGGSIVVWADNRAGDDDWNIYGYDIARRQEFVIDQSPGRQHDPKIDGKYVVWWDYKEWVYLYDLTTGKTKAIHDTWGARLPVVSEDDDLAVWMEYVDGKWDLASYQISTGTTSMIVAIEGNQELPSIAHGLLAYQTRDANNQLDIGVLVLATKTSFPVTDVPSAQTSPAVGDGVVVWEDTRDHQRDIYRFDWTGVVPPVVTYGLPAPGHLGVGSYPTNTIVLKWMDSSEDEEGFSVERAEGFVEARWREVASLPAGATVYTDTAVLSATTYWYRVRAFNASGNSAYSNESFNSTIGATPSLDEQYMMVLINEARAAPEAFGYPGYPPAPPLAFNATLGYSARAHSQSILNAQAQFGHCDLANRCPLERAKDAGYPDGTDCGENLIQGDTGPAFMESANQGFMNSEGHRGNMLSPGFNEVGVGHQVTAHTSPSMFWQGQVTEVFCSRAGVEPPVIPVGAVIPYTAPSAAASTVFTYAVNFYSTEGAPTVALVYIDGTSHELGLSTGQADNGTYRFVTELAGGADHTYYFYFEYGANRTARWPESGEIDLPLVERSLYMPAVAKP